MIGPKELKGLNADGSIGNDGLTFWGSKGRKSDGLPGWCCKPIGLAGWFWLPIPDGTVCGEETGLDCRWNRPAWLRWFSSSNWFENLGSIWGCGRWCPIGPGAETRGPMGEGEDEKPGGGPFWSTSWLRFLTSKLRSSSSSVMAWFRDGLSVLGLCETISGLPLSAGPPIPIPANRDMKWGSGSANKKDKINKMKFISQL